VVPKKYVEKVGDDGFKRAPVGAGPYKFVSFKPGVELVLEANEQYWRKVPSVKRLVLRSIPEEATRAAMLKRGEADIVYLVQGPIAEEIRRDPKLKLVPTDPAAPFWLEFPEQWDPKSPWHDKRVRLAASLSLDRQALNQAETLGLSKLTSNLVPSGFEYALKVSPHAYDPKRAKELLAQAGYPGGFDAGELNPWPPYFSLGEAIGGYLQAVGIRTKMRTMERAAFIATWREKKLRGIILGISGAMGNAATRIEAYAIKGSTYAYGSLPEVDDLFRQQARELDRKKREAMLHQIQRLLADNVVVAPIYELAFLWGVGPRVEEPGANLIPSFAYSGPYEDLKLKKP
jgi:peptide/nickel transport system substrate-binding protein